MIAPIKRMTLPENNFPTVWQTVIFRNYGFVDSEKIAKTLQTDVATIDAEAKRLGISYFERIKDFDENGYITIIRNNWFLLPYEQLCTLTGFSMEKLEFVLKEEDFLWVKLANFKPQCKPVKYKPLSKTAIKKTENIAKIVSKYYENGYGKYFKFFDNLSLVEVKADSSTGTRMIHGYITPCGDVFTYDSNTYLPDALLSTYAQNGVNAIFIHGLLSALSYYPFNPKLCEGYEERRKELKSLIKRAERFGIKIYLYLNEPRCLDLADFKGKEYLKGTISGNTATLCMEQKEVQDYLYTSVKDLLVALENLGGIFTITMSENLTNCSSRVGDVMCPVCANVRVEETVTKVNNIMLKACQDSNTGAELIANIWGWDSFREFTDENVKNSFKLLDKDVAVMATSEYSLEFEKGGVKNRLTEYSISTPGPSQTSKNNFKLAGKYGHKLYAKIQIACSWECACVPYVPVFDLTYKHVKNLDKLGIKNFLLTWTLGGYPSPSLDMISSVSSGLSLNDWYNKYFGEFGEEVHNAVKKLCKGFSEYPLDVSSLYYSPETMGAGNLWNVEPDNKASAMVSYAFDDYKFWCGAYGYDVYVNQLKKLLKGFKQGINALTKIKNPSDKVKEVLLYAKVCHNHFEASLLHTQYSYLKTDILANKAEILKVVKAGIKNADEMIGLQEQDSRIAYEASNHYFYIKSNLVEKVINLKRIYKEIKKMK